MDAVDFWAWAKEAIPKDWKQISITITQVFITLLYLLVVGQNIQMVEEMFWIIGFGIAAGLTFVF